MPPFFSVVVPTKNRSFLVGNAIESVLRQTFRDFELIVADNDDTDATTTLLRRYTDPRLRHLRTGNLSMPDNWEAGVAQTTGQYLVIIEDKQVLKLHALERMAQVLEREQAQVLTWHWDTYLEGEEGCYVKRGPRSGRLTVKPSVAVLAQVVGSGFDSIRPYLPHGFNCCVHRTIIDRLTTGPTGRVCLPVAPDLTMAFQVLATADRVYHLDESLSVLGSLQYSNGDALARKKPEAQRFIREVGGPEALYRYVPLRIASINGNLVFNDYVRLRRQLGGNLTHYPLPKITYYSYLYHEMCYLETMMGVDMRAEKRVFAETVAKESSAFRRNLQRRLRPIVFRYALLKLAAGGRDLLIRTGIWRYLRRLRRAIGAKEYVNARTTLDFILEEERRRLVQKGLRSC